MQKGLVNKIQQFLEENNLADYDLVAADAVKTTRPAELNATLTIKIKKAVVAQTTAAS